jgi:hypothetical protein
MARARSKYINQMILDNGVRPPKEGGDHVPGQALRGALPARLRDRCSLVARYVQSKW